MVINGQAVKGAKRLANHLMKAENEKVSILEISGTAVNDNLHEALRDMETIGKLTKSQSGKVLYHANINPRKNEVLTPEQYQKACDALMEKLGMQGQPRAIVMHQKQGRQHAHLVVQLTDVNKGKLKTISNNYYKHKEVARSLEKELELARTHEEKTGRSYTQSEAQQAKKAGRKAKTSKNFIQHCYQSSRDGKDFVKKLSHYELYLAKGKRLVVIDKLGQAQSLTRQLRHIDSAHNVKNKLKDVEASLPEAKGVQENIRSYNNERKLEKSAKEFDGQRKYQQNRHQINLAQESMVARLDYYRDLNHEQSKIKERERER